MLSSYGSTAFNGVQPPASFIAVAPTARFTSPSRITAATSSGESVRSIVWSLSMAAMFPWALEEEEEEEEEEVVVTRMGGL